MAVRIVESGVAHWVVFAPDPNNTAFPMKPAPVKSRLIRDIEEYPDGVRYVSFHDTVETVVEVGDGPTVVVSSADFNKSDVHFVRQGPEAKERLTHEYFQIAVHPSLEGQVSVWGSQQQAVAQLAA